MKRSLKIQKRFTINPMKWCLYFCLSLLALPSLVHASVADDINALLDRFFGGDQAPVEEIDYTDTDPTGIIPDILEPDTPQAPQPDSPARVELQREIMQQEAELEAFEANLRAQEQASAALRANVLTNQQQLQLLDEQIEINRRKLEFYGTQVQEWKALVETLTREKSSLRAQMRVLEAAYADNLSKNFIQKQNFQLNPTMSWWQWMFSDKSVSELLNERRQTSSNQSSQARALGQFETLKAAFDAQEQEAVNALSKVRELEIQLAKDQVVLKDLAEAKATMLVSLNENSVSEDQRLEQLRQAQNQTTQYLQDLRQQLQETQTSLVETEIEVADLLAWPLQTPVTISAGFKDPQYEINYGREHLGIDLVTSQGSDVLAAAEGLVSKVATDASGYTYLILQHESDLFTIYGHLSNTLVKEGELVSVGQVIAWSGGTPGTPGAGFFTSGPHLHFEVFSGGEFLDPLLFLPE